MQRDEIVAKLTMREWAELAACAESTKTARKLGLRSHHMSAHWKRDEEPGALTRKGLLRWPSANRVVVTRRGFALLACKTKRFLDYARRIAERDYEPSYE